jgi:CHAT domain-containing protein
LIVLSACHSGGGRTVPGEGLAGLARSILLAGAERVIGAKWPVDDEASARLFEHFYRFLWSDPALSPGAALRTAQLALKREPRFRSPFYWGAFFLLGRF